MASNAQLMKKLLLIRVLSISAARSINYEIINGHSIVFTTWMVVFRLRNPFSRKEIQPEGKSQNGLSN